VSTQAKQLQRSSPRWRKYEGKQTVAPAKSPRPQELVRRTCLPSRGHRQAQR
jgi:hypothetical protein